ncbi:MAG: hypothetical protein KatS3mg124_1085 [Porticoccaceae bacterium]|nr:MAG: hypothetical protein KatS3mg124_1085 [Porticoccaceae bacterium]
MTARHALLADDPRYAEMFDVARETLAAGGEVYEDLTPRMVALARQAPVMEGSIAELLGLPAERHQIFEVQRPHYTLWSFAACDRALRENEVFSSAVYRESPGVRRMGENILSMTGARHRAYRGIVQPKFIRPVVASLWRPRWIQGAVDALLDNLHGRERADLNLELCARLPVHVVSEGIGIGGERALDFRYHLLRATVLARNLSPEEIGRSFAVVRTMLQELIDARRAEPTDDVMSALVTGSLELPGEDARPLTDEEIVAFCLLVMTAGGGTTWRQLGITLVALLSDYRLWEACREDRSLVEAAVEESARWMPTDPTFPRLVMEDVEVEGMRIPAGCRVDMCLATANRDPSRWDHPDVYDPFRPRQSHLGFGMGPHRCLGMEVAKMEMVLAINGLLERFPHMTLDPDAPPPRLLGGLHQRGYSAVPVRFNA